MQSYTTADRLAATGLQNENIASPYMARLLRPGFAHDLTEPADGEPAKQNIGSLEYSWSRLTIFNEPHFPE